MILPLQHLPSSVEEAGWGLLLAVLSQSAGPVLHGEGPVLLRSCMQELSRPTLMVFRPAPRATWIIPGNAQVPLFFLSLLLFPSVGWRGERIRQAQRSTGCCAIPGSFFMRDFRSVLNTWSPLLSFPLAVALDPKVPPKVLPQPVPNQAFLLQLPLLCRLCPGRKS